MHRQHSHAGLASLVQSRGRNGDTMLVHMSPEEVHGLHALALATGGMPSINPDTGLYEFGWLKALLPTILGAVLAPLTAGTSLAFLGTQLGAGLAVGGVEALRTGDIGKGLLAGLGAYGGAGIGSSLFSAGAGATAANAAGAVADGGLTETIYGGIPEAAAKTAAGGLEGLKQAGTGLSNVLKNPSTVGAQFAKDVGIKNATMAAAPALAMNPTSNISSSNIPQAEFYVGSRFSQVRNPKWRGDGSAPGEPYFIQKYTPGTFSKTYQSPEQTLAMANATPAPSSPSSPFLTNPLDLQQPTFYGAEGGVIPRPNPSYPQAAITHSNYAAPFQYNRPQELIDGYEPKINPFTGEERFADGGLASIPRDSRTTGPATMEQFMRENPQPPVNPLDPTGALKSYYTNMLNPENAPKAPSTSALEDYMRNLNLSLRGTTDASQIQKTKPVEPTRPTAQTVTPGQNVNLGDYGAMLGFNPMAGMTSPYAGTMSGQYQYDPVTKTYKNPAQIAAAQTTTPTVTPPVNPFVPSGGGMPTVDYGTSFMNLASGGNIEYAAGGKFLRGPGDGMSDDIRANIEGRQEARLADGEFVIPADVVSHLGNGSSEAGSRKLYGMMDRIRQARTGRKKQAPAVKADKYMPA